MTLRGISDGASQLPEYRADGDHADAHHLLLQIKVKSFGIAMNFQDGAALFAGQALDHLPQAAMSDGDLTCKVENVIQSLDVRSKCAPSAAAWGSGAGRRGCGGSYALGQKRCLVAARPLHNRFN